MSRCADPLYSGHLMPLAAGSRLGAYEIISLLGAGGMGEVYRARDTDLKREVAIKVLLSSLAGDAERLARLRGCRAVFLHDDRSPD